MLDVALFVSSQVELLLVQPYFLLIVPLYVLLGRCSVILSWAGCLYNPRTEIWLARPECLSFFCFPPSPPLLRSSPSLFIPLSPPLLFACLPRPLCTPLKDEISSRAAPSRRYFFHVKPCISFKPPPFLFLDIQALFRQSHQTNAVRVNLYWSISIFSLLEPPNTLLWFYHFLMKETRVMCKCSHGKTYKCPWFRG